ncbi:hypothetical protein BHM03_00018676 [Ensete ventricosum]|uniref:Uncharacterized protein n=1 Tax=Ensete ventricosum TaxID=4639 RepID=A0A445MFG5_ENSVE|nr:hypothetical protein BHM03_00018676 [Ensete ventricosum]
MEDGLGLPDTDAWNMIEKIAEKNNLGYKQLVISSDSTKTGATSGKADLPPSGQKKLLSSMRILKGHSGAITALHCVSRREVWDLVGDREDAGFFISGSTDCLVACRPGQFWHQRLKFGILVYVVQNFEQRLKGILGNQLHLLSIRALYINFLC